MNIYARHFLCHFFEGGICIAFAFASAVFAVFVFVALADFRLVIFFMLCVCVLRQVRSNALYDTLWLLRCRMRYKVHDSCAWLPWARCET